MLVQPREIEQFPDDKLVIISTGSQGEPLSALRRMAYRDHPQVELSAGDTVVFSATPIPGNERAVNETIDRLYHIGCDVVTARDAPIHASGHGYQEEMKLMLNLTKPRYVMPFHGDHKRILLHSELARRSACRPRTSSAARTACPLEIDERAPAAASQSGRDGLRRRRGHRRRRRRRAARPPHALGGRHLHHRRDDLRAGRLLVVRPRCSPAASRSSTTTAAIVEDPRRGRGLARPRRRAASVTDIEALQNTLHDDLAKFIYDRLRRRAMVLRSSSRSSGPTR
jgi:ribonuclease J